MFGKRKKKIYDDDDGRTIVDMNVEGFPWYRPRTDRTVTDEDKPTRKETWAMIRAGFAAYVPRILSLAVGFGITVFIIYCWLHGWSLK